MDIPQKKCLTLTFGEAKAVRTISLELLDSYPNCPLLIGWKETGSDQVRIYDMAPEEFDAMMQVVNGEVAVHQCSARIRELLDSCGFVDQLEHRVHARLLEQNLVIKLASFYDAQTNIVLCSSQEEYVQCKEILKSSNVIPIQVLTIGNHLLFCSCAQGAPLFNVMNNDTKGTRMDHIPVGVVFGASELIRSSLQCCQNVLIKANKQTASECIGARGVVGLQGCTGEKGVHGLAGPVGHAGYRNPPVSYCGYCGTSNCSCNISQVVYKDLSSANEVVYCSAMFELINLWTRNKLPHKPIQLQHDPVSLLDEKQQQAIKVVICGHKWFDVPVIRSMIIYPQGDLTKLNMHLGFVRI